MTSGTPTSGAATGRTASASTGARLLDRLANIGARASDTREVRLRKQALVLIALSITGLATIWTLTFLWLGQPLAAASPLAYQLTSLAGLLYLARSGSYEVFRFVQTAAILVLPFTTQWSLGGFVESSAVMVWAFTAPLSALVFYGPRGALVWFVAYMCLAVLSGLIDPLLPAAAVLSADLRLAFFVLNIGGVSVVTFAVLQYFVRALVAEQDRSERLLRNILPDTIADRLKSGEQLIADDHPEVTVLFADVANFSQLARQMGAGELVGLLDELFSSFDGLAERHGLEKIKTMGDAYMAVAGAPEARSDHALAAAHMALAMVDAVGEYSARKGARIELRVGLHSGHVVAGVIGRRKFAYDLWGDAVNLASRMESHGVPGRVQVSESVAQALAGAHELEERGSVELKGLGSVRTYFLGRPAS